MVVWWHSCEEESEGAGSRTGIRVFFFFSGGG